MAAAKGQKSIEDAEKGLGPSGAADDESDGSLCFSDAEEQPWHSPCGSHCAAVAGSSSIDEALPLSTSLPESCRCSSASACSHGEIDDLEIGILEVEADESAKKPEKDCRICQLGLEGTPESGAPIELGCSCKHDLGTAHRQCAETWFKIKGNKICEICGSTAKNVTGASEAETAEQWNDTSSNPLPTPPTETRSFWQGHRFLNFLLACMVFAFVISWLFHFNVPG